MKFFIDTADTTEIRAASELGLVDGVTTNPTLYAKAGGGSYEDVLEEICGITSGPVSAEVIADDIRKNERDDRCVCGSGKAAALQQGEMFSDRIHLLDGCAASEEQPRRSLRIGQGYTRHRGG